MALVRVLLCGYVGDVCVARIVLETLDSAFLAQRRIDELEAVPEPDVIALKKAIEKALKFPYLNFFFLREQIS